MKILFISSLYSPNVLGGAEKVAQLLAQGLAVQGHKITVLTTQPTGSVKSVVLNDVNIVYLPVHNLYHPFNRSKYSRVSKGVWHLIDSCNPWMAKEVGRVLDELKPDVIHTHAIAAFSPHIWQEAYRRSVPILHTLHDYYLSCPRATKFRGGGNCAKSCFDCRIFSVPRKYASRHVSGVIGVSGHILNAHLNEGYFPKATVKEVVFNANTLPLRKKCRRVNRPFRFGFLGRIVPSKGIEHLINAFLKLPPGKAELWIGGTGEENYIHNLQTLSKDGGIRWLGYVKPMELMDIVDVFVLPSIWGDPAPLVAQEAMARGLPIIAARCGGIPELVGNAGWFYDPAKSDELEGLLQMVSGQDAIVEALGQIAYEQAHRFNQDEWVAKHEKIYEQLTSPLNHGI